MLLVPSKRVGFTKQLNVTYKMGSYGSDSIVRILRDP
jgi:hypothetical protein